MPRPKKDSSRTPRSANTRETQTRRKPWQPPSMLETPEPPPGMKYRWIRAEMMGEADKLNIGKRFREGYEPVHPDEIDGFDELPTVDDGKHAGVIGVGGLILAQIPEETAQERRNYYDQMTKGQMDSIDAEMLKNSQTIMPMGAPVRQTRTTFGNPENKPSSED